MTEMQKQRITAMRINGMGYKKIAAEVGISRDAVRYFCKTNITEVLPDGETCRLCGGSIGQSARGRKRLFCSEKCRRSWWAAHPQMGTPGPDAVYKITCAGCGREFENYGNRSRKYCSHSCFVKARWYSNKLEEVCHEHNGTTADRGFPV